MKNFYIIVTAFTILISFGLLFSTSAINWEFVYHGESNFFTYMAVVVVNGLSAMILVALILNDRYFVLFSNTVISLLLYLVQWILQTEYRPYVFAVAFGLTLSTLVHFLFIDTLKKGLNKESESRS